MYYPRHRVSLSTTLLATKFLYNINHDFKYNIPSASPVVNLMLFDRAESYFLQFVIYEVTVNSISLSINI